MIDPVLISNFDNVVGMEFFAFKKIFLNIALKYDFSL